LMRGDETRGKILHIAFDIVLIGGVIIISLLANEILKLLGTVLLFLNDISPRLRKRQVANAAEAGAYQIRSGCGFSDGTTNPPRHENADRQM